MKRIEERANVAWRQCLDLVPTLCVGTHVDGFMVTVYHNSMKILTSATREAGVWEYINLRRRRNRLRLNSQTTENVW